MANNEMEKFCWTKSPTTVVSGTYLYFKRSRYGMRRCWSR